MKLKLLILLLLGMCLKNVAASDKKKRGGGRLKKAVGVSFLLLNDAMAAATTPTKDIVCPTTLPPYSFDMMNYIRCGEKDDTADFFDKYVTVRYSNGKIVNGNCSTIAAVYQKVKSLGKCASEKFTSIVSGAQQKILGKTLNHEKELQMFEEYLVNIDGVDDKVEALSEAFEKLNKPDFFQIKRAADFFKKYEHMNTAEALELALTPQNQELDFDKVERMMPYVKTMRGTADELIKEALDPKYQVIDFDKTDSVRQQLVLYGLDGANGIMELVEPINQNLNWEKVIRMIPYAKVFANSEYDAIEKITETKNETIDFDKVDYIHSKRKEEIKEEKRKMKSFPKNVSYQLAKTWQRLNCGHFLYRGTMFMATFGMTMFVKCDKYLEYSSYMQILEAIRPEYQNLDFDKADYIHSLLLKTTSNKFDAATDALSVKYQNYDVSRMRMVFEGVNSLILSNFNYAAEQALQPWIQEKSFNSEKVKTIFNDCKNNKNKETCWKLKTKDMRKADL